MRRRRNWLLILGVALVLAGLILVLVSTLPRQLWHKQAQQLAQQIEAALPEKVPGIPETFVKKDMPALGLQGADFIGLVEIPAYGIKLPLCGSWQPGKINRFPCRFTGTVYDSSLIIGGSHQQLSCLKKVGHGDVVTVTDLQGAVYTYRVSGIRRTDNARIETLERDEANLVLFIRDLYTMEYIIVACK